MNYRSIGTAPDYVAGSVAAMAGSPVVTGTGTQWVSANRGRGDRILIDGTNYTILKVDSQTQLRLTTAFTGATGSGKAHTISRQYATLQAWENCISFGGACSYFPVASASLVADLRSEVGIAYDDAVGTDFPGVPPLVIDGSTTDAGHTITLTADGGNRHYGLQGQGVVITNGANNTPAVQVYDNFVTVEWMEITGGTGSADGIRVNTLSAGVGSLVQVRNNLVRNVAGDGIALYDDDGRVDVYNNIVHGNAGWGLWINPPSLLAASRLRILNNTFYGNTQAGLQNGGAGAATILLRNNISFGNGGAEYSMSSLDPTSSHNLSSDATATAASPAGNAQTGVTLAQIAFYSTTAGSENLHIRSASVAREQGVDLSTIFFDDIDAMARPEGSLWDKGADEALLLTNYRSIGSRGPYAVGTVTVVPGSNVVTGNGTFWVTNDRGRGDRILIQGTNYPILIVNAEDRLRLAEPYGGPGGTWGYTIARQFTTLQAWQDCISFTTACTYFPVTSSSLVADDRSEIGIAYNDSVFTLATDVIIDGSTTDATHTITLTVDPGNRHNGIAGTGVRVNANLTTNEIQIVDDNVTFEWFEIYGFRGGSTLAEVRVIGPAANNVLLQNLLLHDFYDGPGAGDADGIRLSGSAGKSVTVRNTMIWDGDTFGIAADELTDTLLVENCSINWMQDAGSRGIYGQLSAVTVRNTIVANTTGPNYQTAGGTIVGSNNTSSDATATALFTNGQTAAAAALFVLPDVSNANLHLKAGAVAIDAGLNLSPGFLQDIDGQQRPAGVAWDRGADEFGATTAVDLMSFSAASGDGSVTLAWRTGSEVDNLGFHVHRSLSEEGPWTRLTSSLIPGQGFSAMGAAYTWSDSGLKNGVRYFYRLEDVDSRSVSTSHGPVSAVPQAGATPSPPPSEGGGSGGSGGAGSGSDGASSSCPSWALAQIGSLASYTCETHGDPAATSFRVLSRSPRSVLVELQTEGFLTARDSTGHVRALAPGFDSLSDPLAPALPLKRARLDGVVGRQARIGSIQARDNRFFSGLVAAAVGYPQAVIARDGTVQPGRREAELLLSRGAFPRVQARLAGEGFQGEDKTLALELMPLRYDASRRALVLSRRLTVRVDFAGAEPSEIGRGRLGRRLPHARPDSSAYAFLATSQKGLYSVAFEALFPGRSRPLDLASLRLTARTADPSSPGSDAAPRGDSGLDAAPRGEIPFFVLPQGPTFGPGSRLFFHVDATASSTSFSPEVVYALERGTGGVQMALGDAFPDGSAGVSSRAFASFETNRLFAPDVLDIEDLWQWESLGSGVSKTKPFALDGIDPSSPETARLVVSLQGGSDAVSVVDHHVQVFVNGALVAEESFDGAVPHRVEADVPVSLLAAANDLTVLNVGDTGVSSRVFLDRFEVLYPQLGAARSGTFDGVFSVAGTAEVAGIASPAALLDVTSGASWLTGYEAGPSLRFHAETGHRYLAVSPEALLSPRVFFPEPSARLRSPRTRPTTSSSLPGPSSTPPSPSSSAGRPRASPPSPPPSRRSPPPSAAGRSPPKPSATSSPSPTTSGDGPRPATSSSSVTPTTTRDASTPSPSPPPCPSSSRGPPTSGPPPTPLSSPSTGTTPSPTSPSGGFPPPRWSRPRRWSPRSSTGRPRARTSTAPPPSSPTTPISPGTSRPTPATSRRPSSREGTRPRSSSDSCPTGTSPAPGSSTPSTRAFP